MWTLSFRDTPLRRARKCDCTSDVHAKRAAHFPRSIEPRRVCRDTPQGCFRQEERTKIALLALPGTAQGALVGTAPGVGAGLAWVEIFKTTSFEGDSATLVFFTFIQLGSAIGAIGGAFLLGVIAIRAAEIAGRWGAGVPS